jgi:hypothetical protein
MMSMKSPKGQRCKRRALFGEDHLFVRTLSCVWAAWRRYGKRRPPFFLLTAKPTVFGQPFFFALAFCFPVIHRFRFQLASPKRFPKIVFLLLTSSF